MISVDKRLQLRELKVRVEIVVTEAENAVVRAGLMVTGAQKAVTEDTKMCVCNMSDVSHVRSVCKKCL